MSQISRWLLPPMSALRALEAVDRLGSVTAAARDLDVTQSAVSRQLQTLQDHLGKDLVRREGRGLALTAAARAYAGELRAALGQIARASLTLTVDQAGGGLNLAILPTFGMRWLVPRLSEFARLHPEVTINLTTRLKPFDFADEPFDAAIFFGQGDWPRAGALMLMPESVIAVCAPALTDGQTFTDAAALARLPLLHIGTRPRAWADWFAAQGCPPAARHGAVYDQFSTLTQAALHGLGVALLPDYLVEQDIAAGRLIRACTAPGQSLGAYYLVWPEDRADLPALGTFRDWLASHAGGEDPLPR